MSRTKKQTLEARIRQRNDLSGFLAEHKEYCVAINFSKPGVAVNVCVPVPSEKASVIVDEVVRFLVEETCK